MGLPSGTLWARRYVDVTEPDGFAASELQYGCSYFSWGNIDGHNTVEGLSFGDYTFGDDPNQEPYVSTPGHSLQSSIDNAHDAARNVCGAPWRMPSQIDVLELMNPLYTDFIDANGDVISPDVDNKIITIDGINCIRLRSKINGQILVLPACGFGLNTTVISQADDVRFWLTNYGSAVSAVVYDVSSSVYHVTTVNRSRGIPVRACIKL